MGWSPSLVLLLLACVAGQSQFVNATRDCYGSVGGANGHIYQFDGGRVSTFSQGCQFLLTRSRLKSCNLELYASFGCPKSKHKTHKKHHNGLSQLRALTVKIGGKTFMLLRGRRLLVDGKPVNVPHSQHGIRVFYSGEDLVLVSKKCPFWVTFDGYFTATFLLSSIYRHNVFGLAGNCNGRKNDDKFGGLSRAFKLWKSKGWVTGCHSKPKTQTCHTKNELREAETVCRKVIGRHSCSSRDVLEPCIIDYCSSRYRPDQQKEVLCANFYLHSRRCARHHHPLAWRHKSGCELKCGLNQHFSRKANPCPKTCDNHFFGTRRHCYKLPEAEGCRCNKGYVLDGTKCVKPNYCECLSKLCIDRVSHTKCRQWKAQGRCGRYPEVMGRFCRLTCGMCTPQCSNQISTQLCKQIKSKGKCSEKFYRVMCQATCEPNKCPCSPKRRIESKCTHKYQNRAVTTLHWYPDSKGRCKKSILTRYYACGSCPYKSKVTWDKCNYCKGVQHGKRLLRYREKRGKKRCLIVTLPLHRKCPCPPVGKKRQVSHTECRKHTVKLQIIKTYKAAKHCHKCTRETETKVLSKLKCGGLYHTGKCTKGHDYYIQKTYRRYPYNCRCLSRLVQRNKIMCRCSKPKSVTVCKSKYYLTKTTKWTLKNGHCVPKESKKERKIHYHRNYRSWVHCHRQSCKATRHINYFYVRNCKIHKYAKGTPVGKCCCPKGSKKHVRINHYWKKLVVVTHVLINYKCHKRVVVYKIRTACPKGGVVVKCDGHKGRRLYTKHWFVKKGNHCIKKISTREAHVKCRRDIKRLPGQCHILVGNVRYRHVEFHYYKRKKGSCVCVQAKRSVKEMCGCRGGKYTKVTRCPSGCSSKKCGHHCKFYKEFYYYKVYGKHCRVHVFKRLPFRCCCEPKRHVKTWCHKNHYLMQQVSYYKLKAHKCQRVYNTSSKRIHCNRKSETKKVPHKKKGYYILATYTWHVSHCKCQVRIKNRTCRKYCPKQKVDHYCDAVRRHKVTRYTTWSLRNCYECVPYVRDRRVPVHCSRSVKKWKHCNKHTGYVTHYKQWWHQKGCKCLLRKSSKRLRCKCPKPVVGRSYCNPNKNAFEKKVTYWILSNGHCLKKKRTESKKVECSCNIHKRTECKAKSGIKVVYHGVMRPKKCKCVLVWSVHNKSHRCNCNKENAKAKHIKRPFCDKKRNLKGIEKFYYVLKHGKCHRKSRKTYHSFRCPHAYDEKQNCNESRHLQLVLTHYSVKKNCHCVKLVKRKYVKCGCHGKKVEEKRYCKKVQGEIVHVLIKRKWSNKRHECITDKKTSSHRVLCRTKTRYINSKCIKNKYYVETKVYYVRQGCKCVKRHHKRNRNCHCKRVIRRGKCPHNGYTLREVIEVKEWNMKLKRCQTKRYLTNNVRCRCPKNYKKRYCKSGQWVNESVHFILRDARCYKKVDKNYRKVHCSRVVKNRYTKCHGCHRYHYTLERRLHPGRCACYYAVIRKRRCPCCCPKNYNKRYCVRDNQWERVFKHHAPLTGSGCGCRSWVTRHHENVRCSTKKTYKWLKCNRHSCYSHQQVTYYKAKKCHCEKKHRLTGKKRTCCCHTKPQFSKICKLSSIYEKKIYYQLHNWRCERRHKLRLLYHWNCKKKPRVEYGKCHRSTCRQSVEVLASVVVKPHCRCKYVVQKRYTRPCCCNKQPHHSKKCERNCWVTRSTKYTFDSRRRVCIAHNSHKSNCVHCPRPCQEVGKCNKKSCRQRIAYISYSLNKCKCKKRVDYRERTCCCSRPVVSGPVCRSNRYKVWYHYSWKLVGGKCVRSVKETRRKVYCRKGVTRVLNCNKHTCRQTLRHETLTVNRCHCSSSWKETHRTCCCRPAKYSNTKCVKDRYKYRYVTTRTLNRHYKCVSHTKRHLLHSVRNCQTYEKRTGCNKLTRHSTVYIYHRRISHCKCVTYRRSKRHVLCRCADPKETRGKCNKKTCHMKVTKTWYTSHGKLDKFKCKRHHRAWHLRCCCHRQPSEKSYCDKRTGSIMKLHTWTVFLAASRTCVKRHSESVVRKLVCPKNKCHFGKCNKKTGYKIRYCSHYTKVHKHCRCKEGVTHKKFVCSCPRGHSKSSCQGHTQRVTVHTYWKISTKLNKCVKTVKRVTDNLVCPKRRGEERKCKGCRGVKYVHHYYMHRCRCLRKTRSHHVLCCCPKSSHKKRCLGDHWLIKREKYELRNGACKKVFEEKPEYVACKKKKTKRGKCKGCVRKHDIWYYHVRDCKCRLRKHKVKKTACCCQKPRKYTQCKADKVQLKISESWSLCSGKCLKNRRVVSTEVICAGFKSRRLACNTETLKQKVVQQRPFSKDCKCFTRQVELEINCVCRPTELKPEECGNKAQRKVFLVTYQLFRVNGKEECKPQPLFLYFEPCRCPEPDKIKKCAPNGKVLVTTRKHWTLETINGRRVCVEKTSETQTPVYCEGKSVHWTRCKNYQKTRITTKYKPVKCKCHRVIQKKTYPCDCNKKSYKRKFCDHKRGSIVNVCKKYHSCCGAKKCSFVSRKTYKQVHCSKRQYISRISSKCGIAHNHGYYTRYLVKWTARENCKCVSKQKKIIKLCKCKRNGRSTKCSSSGRYYVTVHYNYKRKGSICKFTQHETRRPVVCKGKKVLIRHYGCQKCKRQVSLTHCYVHSCKTHHYRKSAFQHCCTPKSHKRHYCDARKGRFVFEKTTYHLVKKGHLLRDHYGRWHVPKLKVVSKKHHRYVNVKCPKQQQKEHCDKRSGYWSKTLFTWHRVGCHCVKRKKHWRGRCHCPSPQTRWGKCHNRHVIKTVTYFVLKNRVCVRQVRKHQYICACHKDRKYTVCDRKGHWKTCHVSYQLNFKKQKCVKSHHCRRRPHTCSAHKDVRGRCVHFKRVIKRYVWRLDKKKCKCIRSVHPRHADCDCHKKKHSNTVCKYGAFLTTNYWYKQVGEKCARYSSKVAKPVYCDGRRKSKIVHGSCVKVRGQSHLGYQKLLTEWKVNKNCKCVRKHIVSWVPCVCSLISKYKTRNYVQCVRGSVVQHTNIYYKLVGHSCVKKVRKHHKQIYCVGSRTHRGKCQRNKHGDKYSVIRLTHKVSNGKCGCVWKQHSQKYHICQCRKHKQSHKCLNHRVWRSDLVTFHPVAGKHTCKHHLKRNDKRIICKKPFSRKGKCKLCGFNLYHYAYKHVKCKCVPQLVRVQKLKCCCPKPHHQRTCDSKRHMKITVTTSYHLHKHACHSKRSVHTYRVRCGRKTPSYKFSGCNKGYRKVYRTVKYTAGCECKSKTTVHNQRCACSKARTYHAGKCGRWFAVDVWTAYRLQLTGKNIPGTSKPEKKCVKYVADKRKRRCRCPKGYKKRICKAHNLEVLEVVSYHLRDNCCERKRTEHKRHLPCSTKLKLVRVDKVPQKCTSKNKYTQVLKYVYVHAKQCHCVHVVKHRKRVCDCLKKYGRKKEKRCVGHNRLVTHLTWWEPKGYGCKPVTRNSEHAVTCKGDKTDRGKCKSNGLREYRLYKRQAHNCHCIWHLVKRVNVPCRCHKPVATKKCISNHWVTVKKSWRLVGKHLKTHCQPAKHAHKHKVPCKVGRYVHRSDCDFKGVQHIVTTEFTLKKCHCQKHVKRNTCRCRCHKPSTRRYCRGGHIWETVKYTSRLHKCVCYTDKNVSRKTVTCKKSHNTHGKCKRGSDGDKYIKHTYNRWVVHHCKCRHVKKVSHRLCACNKRRKVEHKCLSGFIKVTTVTERRLKNGKCKRVRVSQHHHRLQCGKVKVNKICHKKSGELSIFVTKPYVKHCHCYRKVTRHSRRCGCHHGSKLVSIGKCNKKSCRQRLLYKKQVLSDEKCIWKNYHKHRVCCCKGHHQEVKCSHKRGYLITKVTKIVLKNWKCVKAVTKHSKKIKCKRNETVKKHKLPHGVLKVVQCHVKRHGCKCKKHCKNVYLRYSCNKPIHKLVCKCTNGCCQKESHVTYWKLLNGHCLKQTRRSAKPIHCKSNQVYKSHCNKKTKYGYYYVEKSVSWYQKSCRCHKRVKNRSVVCRCFKAYSKKHCHKGHIVTLKYSFRLSHGRCVKIVHRHSQAVKCKTSWRLSHHTAGKPVYYKFYKRYVLSNCKCVKETKRVPCRSQCSKCTVSHKCEHGRYAVAVKVCLRLVGCHCIRYSKVSRYKVRCPKSTKRDHCHHCQRTVSIKQYSVHGCKCVLTPHVKKSKCCCPKPEIKQTCVRGSKRIRHITHKLKNGRCYSNTKDTYRPVNCSRHELRAIHSKCHAGKQKYTVHYWVKIGCKCVRRVRHEFRKCACAHKAVELFLVVDLYGKDKHGYKSGVKNFLKTLSKYFLQTSAKVRIVIISYNWNVYVHQVKNIKKIPTAAFTNKRTDLYGALKEVERRLYVRSKSGVEKIVVIISCGNHSKQRKTVALADKIKRRASVFVVGVHVIPKYGKYIKWLASKPLKVHYMELGVYQKHHFSATRLFEKICQKTCAKPVVKHSKCHKHNCRRVYTRITYHMDQHTNKCVRRANNWWKLCCCVHRDSSHKVCDKNRLYRVDITYRFHKHVCHRHVRKHDISSKIHAACKPSHTYHRGKCRKDGWRKDTTETRKVVNCHCRVTPHHQLIRCRCPKPYVRSACVKGNRVQHCRYTYSLKPKACIKHRKCHSTSVTCKSRHTSRGKCNKSSCKRTVGSVWYSVQNCKCKRHYRVWKEVCCCKRKYQKYRYCDKRQNHHVDVESWLELHGTGCRRVSKKIVRPVHCKKPHVEYSKCLAKRDGYYRKKLEHHWRKNNCCCTKHTVSHYQLCRCRQGHTVKKCQSGSWVFIYHWWHKSGNKCIPRHRITSSRKVTCSSKRHDKVGSCSIVKGDQKYAKVVQSWQKRVGCSCKTVYGSVLKLCACRKPYKRHTCHGNYRHVVTTYHFVVHGNSCKLRKTSNYRLISCPKADTKVSKCVGKTQLVKVILHHAKKCKCLSKKYTRSVECKSKCRNLLPTKICKKWAASNKIQLCDKYPYFAKRLCPKTCHQCYDCPKTRVIYAGNFCLSKQRHFRSSFILARSSSFDTCLQKCQHTKECQAFDYDHTTRKCILLRINRMGLILRYPSLNLRKTGNCILFERICPKECPFRSILKHYKCKCIKFGKNRACYRTAAVATWKRDRSGKCKRSIHKLLVPCSTCEDSRSFCTKSKCSKQLVRDLCNYTCGVCKRKPKSYHHISRCSKSNWQKDTRVSYYYDTKLRLWLVQVSIKDIRCVQCPVGSYQLIGQCKNGKRKITNVAARYVKDKCRVSSHVETVSCKDCGLTTKQLVSKCHRRGKHWIREVVTQYTMRLHGHCIVRRSLAVFSCSPKCRHDHSSVSPCKCGKRIRCVHYYITYPGSHVCVPKSYTTSEKCAVKSCRDRMHNNECLFVKKTKMCKSMRSLCAKTCGYCR